MNTIERPILIKLICILGVLGNAMTVWWTTSSPKGTYENWLLYWWVGSSLLMLISLLGIWRMKKWGANVYVVVAISGLIMLFFTGREFLTTLIVSIAIIFVLLRNYSKMT